MAPAHSLGVSRRAASLPWPSENLYTMDLHHHRCPMVTAFRVKQAASDGDAMSQCLGERFRTDMDRRKMDQDHVCFEWGLASGDTDRRIQKQQCRTFVRIL